MSRERTTVLMLSNRRNNTEVCVYAILHVFVCAYCIYQKEETILLSRAHMLLSEWMDQTPSLNHYRLTSHFQLTGYINVKLFPCLHYLIRSNESEHGFSVCMCIEIVFGVASTTVARMLVWIWTHKHIIKHAHRMNGGNNFASLQLHI